jgi:hypothetical protein
VNANATGETPIIVKIITEEKQLVSVENVTGTH